MSLPPTGLLPVCAEAQGAGFISTEVWFSGGSGLGLSFPVFIEWVPGDEARAEPMRVHRHTHTLSHTPQSPAPSLPEHLGLAWPRLREPGCPWVAKGTTSVHWTTGAKAAPGIPSRELGDLVAVTTPQGMWFSREVNGSGLPAQLTSAVSARSHGGALTAGSVPGCPGGGVPGAEREQGAKPPGETESRAEDRSRQGPWGCGRMV